MAETNDLVEKLARGLKDAGIGDFSYSTRLCLASALLPIIEAHQSAAIADAVEAWQPIETAPKDECEILAWDGFAVFHAYWYGQHRFAETVEKHSGRPHVTHWRPLPPPPAIRSNDHAG